MFSSSPLPKSEREKNVLAVLEEMDRNQRRGSMSVPMEDGRILRVLAEASVCTANSIAAAVEFVLPVTPAGGTMFPTFFTTNKSPGLLCVINSAITRESEHVMNSVCGFCPSFESRRNNARY
jgi:hypothetical protein